MELEEGMYVRTKQGYIAKFKEYDEMFDMLRFETPIFLRSWMPCDYMQKERFVNRYFLKASFDIIDLMEVGDYVNGYKVIDITDYVIVDLKVPTGDSWRCREFSENEIKSIVTKEMYASMEYKVNE